MNDTYIKECLEKETSKLMLEVIRLEKMYKTLKDLYIMESEECKELKKRIKKIYNKSFDVNKLVDNLCNTGYKEWYIGNDDKTFIDYIKYLEERITNNKQIN